MEVGNEDSRNVPKIFSFDTRYEIIITNIIIEFNKKLLFLAIIDIFSQYMRDFSHS